MPFKSKKQWRAAFAGAFGKDFDQKRARKWAKESPSYKSLPEEGRMTYEDFVKGSPLSPALFQQLQTAVFRVYGKLQKQNGRPMTHLSRAKFDFEVGRNPAGVRKTLLTLARGLDKKDPSGAHVPKPKTPEQQQQESLQMDVLKAKLRQMAGIDPSALTEVLPKPSENDDEEEEPEDEEEPDALANKKPKEAPLAAKKVSKSSVSGTSTPSRKNPRDGLKDQISKTVAALKAKYKL